MSRLIPHPKHALAHSERVGRWQLARQWPGKYQLTVQKGAWLTRYVSDAPSQAIAEAWCAKLDSNAPEHWALLDIANQAEPQDSDPVIFFVQVTQGVVREARCLLLSELPITTLKRCEAWYVTSEVPTERLPEGDWHVVPALTDEECAPYALKRDHTMSIALTVLSVVLVGVLMMFSWHAFDSDAHSKEANTAIPDVYQDYRMAVSKSVSASEAIHRAYTLFAVSSAAPSGWSLTELSLKGTQLNAQLQRDQNAKVSELNAWLTEFPELKAHLGAKAVSLTYPLTEHLSDWQEKIAPPESADDMLDVLTGLGCSLSELERSQRSHFSTTEFTMEQKSAPLSVLATLAAVLEAWPIGVTDMQISPAERGGANILLHLTYFGEADASTSRK